MLRNLDIRCIRSLNGEYRNYYYCWAGMFTRCLQVLSDCGCNAIPLWTQGAEWRMRSCTWCQTRRTSGWLWEQSNYGPNVCAAFCFFPLCLKQGNSSLWLLFKYTFIEKCVFFFWGGFFCLFISSFYMWRVAHCCIVCARRSGDLLQHAGFPGRSVVGHAGGQNLPALPQRCGCHLSPQILPGLL